jgi:hypothetical protein
MNRISGPESGQGYCYRETLLLERAEVFWKARQFVSAPLPVRYIEYEPLVLCLDFSASVSAALNRNSKRHVSPGRRRHPSLPRPPTGGATEAQAG